MSVLSKALRYLVAVILFIGCVTAQSVIAEQSEQGAEALVVGTDTSLGIELENAPGITRLVISPRDEVIHEVSNLTDPDRIVLDLIGDQSLINKTIDIERNPFMDSIRVGAHEGKSRIVLDLTEHGANTAAVHREVEQQGGKVVLSFKTIGADTESQAAAEALVPLTLERLTLDQTAESTGLVSIALSGESAFELRQTAATEYCVIIPGAVATQAARIPQVAPPGTSGIRSARAVQEDNMVMVRMFVDGGISLKAEPRGNDILIQPVAALSGSARAQMAEEDDEDYEDEAMEDERALEETARQNPTGIQSADGSKTYTGRLISLDLQDTDIDNALRIIAEVSNLNIIASDDVTGKVTLRLIDVPWDQALDVILKTNGLDQVTEGNVIRIAPVDKLRQEREALLEAKRAAQNLEDLKVSYIRVSYAQVGEMQPQVEAVLSERGTVTVDERTNQLIIKDISEGQARSAELIQRLDLRTPQVLLETQIVEGDRSILRDLGFQWNFEYNRSPATGNATGMNFPNTINTTGSSDFSAAGGGVIGAVLDSADGSRLLNFELSALESEGKAKVISRPQVATINNRQAEIKSVEVLRIRLPDSGLSVATGSGASASGGASAAFEEIDVGIVLTVTPQASPDYYVLLDVNAKSSTLGSREVDSIPSTIEREATSAVLVKSGTTFALGGVYRIEDRDSLEGLPFLKDIPFLGYLFRKSTVDKSDEELIFFITPHIVEGSFDPGAMMPSVKG